VEAEVTCADWLFDGVVAVVLPILAWRVVLAKRLHEAIVLFIALGLLLALAWARLDAVDVALVEAAVGSGLTGALLMSTVAWADAPNHPPSRAPGRAAGRVMLTGLVVWVGWTATHLPYPSDGLTKVVVENVQRSGAPHPVTAVLLDFRGYDTLMEVAVLFVAALAIRAIQPRPSRRERSPSDLLTAFVNVLVPVSVVTAGYLVWEGSHAPGGAFQAGAILAGSGVVLLLTGRGPFLRMSLSTRAALVLGPGVFIGLAIAPLLGGSNLLEYPRAWAGSLLFGLEIALSISIAVILVMFFPPAPRAGVEARPDLGDAP
jgi:multisubunit Na+/H+ antiporter MnhB subunit